MSNWPMFFQYRVSLFFFLLFLAFFMPYRFSKKKTYAILMGAYLFTLPLEYILNIAPGPKQHLMVYTVIEIILVQGTALIICRFPGFCALFLGITGAIYVQMGGLICNMLENIGFSFWEALGMEILIHILYLLVLVWKLRDLLLDYMEEGNKEHWGSLCLVPSVIWVAYYALTIWPADLDRVPENTLGACALMVLMVIAYALIFNIFAKNKKDSKLQQENAALEVYAQGLKKESDLLQKMETETAIMRHDIRHYSLLINSYLEEGETDKIRELIQSVLEKSEEITMERYCQNLSINSIICYNAGRAQKSGIRFEVKTEIPQELSLDEFELATVVSNLLDNALNAAEERREDALRYVRIVARLVKGHMLLEVCNTYEVYPKLSKRTGLYESPKGKGHGYGLKSVQAFADKYHAILDFTVDDALFQVRLLIPMEL